jgi:hypothetical protein
MQFLTGAKNDTIVLHQGGSYQISGFDPATDALGLGELFSGEPIDLATLVADVSIVDQGPDAVVLLSPTGQGYDTVAVLQGLGHAVTGLNTLLSQNALSWAETYS